MDDCLQCHNLTRSFGRRVVLDGVNWNVPAGSLTGLLGPSGVGKTTLLRILAGLDRPTSGIVKTPASPRNKRQRPPGSVGMVFQDFALWPHLTVWRHVECVLPSRNRRDRRAETERLLGEVQLPRHLWRARPAELSGGEAQRLALARALAPRPQLLLLDEPVNQIDPTLCRHLLKLIVTAVRERGITLVYVSHSWQELATICQRVAVLVDGRLVRDGDLEQVHWKPGSARVARLTGPVVELPRRAVEDGWLYLAIDEQTELSVEDDRMLIRPQQIRPIAAAGRNRWKVGRKAVRESAVVELHSGPFQIWLPAATELRLGDEIGLQIRTGPLNPPVAPP